MKVIRDYSKFRGYNKNKKNEGILFGNREGRTEYGKPGRKLPKHVIDEIRKEDGVESASGVHGNFRCSCCEKYYGLRYGKKVKFYSRPFVEADYVCVECLGKVNKNSYYVEE
jgi:hypothetical protein